MPERDLPRQITADGPEAEVLARYVAGESAPEEVAAVRMWLERYPEQARSVQALEAAMPAPRSAPAVDVEAALAKVHARIAADARVRPLAARAPRARWTLYAGLAAAAGIVLAVGGYVMRPDFANWRAMIPGGNPNSAYQYTSGHRTRMLRLADGTIALMAPNSSVIVSGDYNRGNRTIQAAGLVRFDVHHNPRVPFEVIVGPARVRDVGTNFVIRSVPDTSFGASDKSGMIGGVFVSVTQGAVSLTSTWPVPVSPVELHAGQRGYQGSRAGQRLAGGVPAADTAWTHGQIIFDDTPLSSVRVQLAQWYGLRLRIDDSTLARRRLSATFNASDPIDRVLSTISLAVDAHVERGPQSVTLAPNSAH